LLVDDHAFLLLGYYFQAMRAGVQANERWLAWTRRLQTTAQEDTELPGQTAWQYDHGFIS
jgi:hypothetical protein